MDDGIPDEHSLWLVCAIELDRCGMAGLPGLIPDLGPRSCGGQPLVYFSAARTARQNQHSGGDD